MPIIIPEFENLYLSLYLMAEIATQIEIHPYTWAQKLRSIRAHLRTRHFLGVNPPGKISGMDKSCLKEED